MELFVKTRQKAKKYQREIIEQMLKLATSGFGLVAALAWNELIKTFINDFIRDKISIGSSIISLLIYALIVTALAVFVTLQLSELKEKLSEKGPKE